MGAQRIALDSQRLSASSRIFPCRAIHMRGILRGDPSCLESDQSPSARSALLEGARPAGTTAFQLRRSRTFRKDFPHGRLFRRWQSFRQQRLTTFQDLPPALAGLLLAETRAAYILKIGRNLRMARNPEMFRKRAALEGWALYLVRAWVLAGILKPSTLLRTRNLQRCCRLMRLAQS